MKLHLRCSVGFCSRLTWWLSGQAVGTCDLAVCWQELPASQCPFAFLGAGPAVQRASPLKTLG